MLMFAIICELFARICCGYGGCECEVRIEHTPTEFIRIFFLCIISIFVLAHGMFDNNKHISIQDFHIG